MKFVAENAVYYKFMLEAIICKQYKLVQKIGINPFYEVFRARHIKNQTIVAIKIEPATVTESKLFHEVKITKEIQVDNSVTDYGIPHIFATGTQGDFNYTIMDMMGPSLDRYFAQGKIDLKFGLELGQQMIERIALIHQRGYVHRDLRPEHFLYGRPKKPERLYLTGLSMTKSYLEADKKHIPYKDTKQTFTGIPRFVSINAQLGIQQSRRDDIESILYIIIYLIRGHLPWHGLKVNRRRQKLQKILEVKVTTPLKEICMDLPEIMQELLLYTRILDFEDAPDYQYLKQGLRKAKGFVKEQTVLVKQTEQHSLI